MTHQTPAWTVPDDPLGAFCRENHVSLMPTGHGPLDGFTFGVKDVFHIAGHRTGFGNPDWLRTHEPADETASAVEHLLAAGARMLGKTQTDELAYSLTGENAHYGTPVNACCPDRLPGGSSSGSAAAVAGGLVDFALGSDCGGSVRVPASYCGLLGMRPTHGRIPLEGVIPFASSFDVAGWFARDPSLFETVGRVLLKDDSTPAGPTRLLIAEDAFELVGDNVARALARSVETVRGGVAEVAKVTVSPEGLSEWMECFRTVQAGEIWANHGRWIRSVKPRFGAGICDRFEWASQVAEGAVQKARHRREAIASHLRQLIRPGDVLCLPTSPRIAPLKSAESDTIETTYRYQAMCLLCIAGLGGLPQISLPLASVEGCPIGLSLIGARDGDVQLLCFARQLMTGSAVSRAGTGAGQSGSSRS